MNNNDLLIRLKDVLNITNEEIVEIFNYGELELTCEKVERMLVESKNDYLECDNIALEAFLNGFIIFKRGKQEPVDGKVSKRVLIIKDRRSVNNVMLKKLKIAFSLTADDMIDIFKEAGFAVTKGELTPLFRKEGHKHYKKCSDVFAENFLKGLYMRNEK